MPIHPFTPPKGRLDTLDIKSSQLRNVLGDPETRRVAVYVSERCSLGSDRYPLFVDLAAFTNSSLGHLGWKAFAETLPQRIDRLEEAGLLGPAIWVFPETFTSLGGNQFVDSDAMGHWATWLHTDLVSAIEAGYPARQTASARALFGKSSGGFGALHQALNHGEHWGAVACHSGDMGFELGYASDLAHALLYLEQQGSDVPGALKRIKSKKRLGGSDFQFLMIAALSASYDPDLDAVDGVSLPVDRYSGERIPQRWKRWLAFDPLVQLERQDAAVKLRTLKGLFLDCGRRDQYHLLYGARRFADRCSVLNIPIEFQEFDDTHSGIDYRLDESLPYLYASITAN